jgi:hypothetical protein
MRTFYQDYAKALRAGPTSNEGGGEAESEKGKEHSEGRKRRFESEVSDKNKSELVCHKSADSWV